jgi:membrane AbrB-like protein
MVLIVLLELIHIPAALLLGAMASAILLSTFDGRLALPAKPYLLAQGLIGCLIARSISPAILAEMLRQWPVFLISTAAVIFFSSALGALLAYWRVLPGTTAVWGSSPGAATVMVLMGEAFGADGRLIAFMQFSRVVLVALTAAVVARLWGLGGAVPAAIDWFPAIAPWSLGGTLALAIVGAFVGAKSKLPAGALLVPMFAGVLLSGTKVLVIALPPWLMAGCYTLVGWAIGLRFTLEVMRYAAHAFPRIVVAILTLMALCGLLAYALHLVTGADALTAYLATSPGGADSVAIIAAGAKVDLPFVMAMQTARFMLVMAIGPAIARFVAQWTERRTASRPVRLQVASTCKKNQSSSL